MENKNLEPIDQAKEELIKKQKQAEFMNRHTNALLEWRKAHPNTKPPIIEDKDGNLRWVNRKERRRK